MSCINSETVRFLGKPFKFKPPRYVMYKYFNILPKIFSQDIRQ